MDDEQSGADVKPFKRLFIVEGLKIHDFIQTTVLKQLTAVCQADGYKLSVYRLEANAGDYMCVCEDNDLDKSAQITELLAPWMAKAEKCYLFPFQSAYIYNTDKKFDKHCFIRTISNAAVDVQLKDMEPMEDCNILNGISSGGNSNTHTRMQIMMNKLMPICVFFFVSAAATWRHINNLPFVCYAVYMDCMEIDSVVGSMVLELFNQLGLKCETSYAGKSVNTPNLYM